MKTRGKLLLVLAAFLLVITGLRVAWIAVHMPPSHPEIVQGVLDLRNSAIPKDKPFALDGEWEFFPYQLLPPSSEGSAAARDDSVYLPSPGNWNGAFGENSEASFQYGTYRLRILLPSDAPSNLGVQITGAKSAIEVYANGLKIGGTGRPAETASEFVPRDIPFAAYFSTEDREVELLVHMANRAGEGGLKKAVRFGAGQAVERQSTLSIAMQLMLCVVLAMHVMYALVLYFLGPARKSLLYFSLVILSAIISVLASDDRLLFAGTSLSSDWILRFAVLPYIGVSVFIPLLFQSFFPEYAKRGIPWFSYFCGAYALFILIAPTHVSRSMLGLLGIVLYVGMFQSAKALWRPLRDRKDVVFLLLAIISITANVVWTFIQDYPTYAVYYPFDLMIATLCFAAFWFQRFFETNAVMRSLAEKLQEANRRKDEFLVNTSHELRNPLHGMLNVAQSILDDPNGPPTTRDQERLELLISVGRRMSLLLDDLIDVRRLEDNALSLRVRAIDMRPVATGVFDILRFMTGAGPVRFRIDIPERFPAVLADEHRLTQILFNLAHNAVKYTDEGMIAIQAEAKDGIAFIRVTDSGIGIEPETLQHIFLPYEQGTSEAERMRGGFGLGLSIAKRLVELQGGTLQAESVPGAGSTFTFTLPLASEEEIESRAEPTVLRPEDDSRRFASVANEKKEPTAAPTAADAENEPRARVLVIDDDPVNLRILADLLTGDRLAVDTAEGGKEALSRCAAVVYDLVIADVMMPHMSGYEFTRALRERYTVSELPVLLLTARGTPEDIDVGLKSGANDFLRKPVDARELKARVRALIELKQSAKERLRLEGAWLQARIQPHFIFNTLNSIAALSSLDLERMQNLLEAFGSYLRASYDFHSPTLLVPLEKELSLVRAYLYIQKERFGERLRIAWEADIDGTLRIPPLTLQPLVENAIHHGIMRRADGGTVRIRIEPAGERFEVTVADDGVGMDEAALRNALAASASAAVGRGIGLRNTDRRLKQIYGEGLRIESAPGEGTRISFFIDHKLRTE